MTDTIEKYSETSLLKYAGWFAVFYAAFIIAVAALNELASIDLGGGGRVIPLFMAALLAGDRFGKEQSRLFAGGEIWKLALLCLLASYLVSALLTFVAVTVSMDAIDQRALLQMVSRLSGGVIGLAVAVLSVIYYFAIVLFLRAGAKGAMNSAKRKKSKQ